MMQTERDMLKVDVPVGFLLSEPREILVSVDRPADTPLSIRLRLIPAEVEGLADIGSTPARSDHNTPMPIRRLTRRNKPGKSDGYAEHEYGGGD